MLMKILLTNENILKLIYSQLNLSELQSLLNNINNSTFSKIILSLLSYSSIFQSMGRTKHKLDGHKLGVGCIALIKENLLITAGLYDKTLKVWDITKYQCIKSLQDEAVINAITILPNHNIAISSMFYIKIRKTLKKILSVLKLSSLKAIKAIVNYIRLVMTIWPVFVTKIKFGF
jgi:WD40 repeat protein